MKVRRRTAVVRLLVVTSLTFVGLPGSLAQDATKAGKSNPPAEGKAEVSMTAFPQHHCLFILGLAGDPSHQQQFRKVADAIHRQLEQLGFPAENITLLGPTADGNLFPHAHPDTPAAQIGEAGTSHAAGVHGQATAEDSNRFLSADKSSIEKTVGRLVETLKADDSLWVIFIGHADHDGEHARFHIPGPDLRAIDYADLFAGLVCKRQVFWLTMSSSGWFTEPLSKANRIVVTATTRDAEPNETEFPAAFAAALASPLSLLDRDQNGESSVLELFATTHELVEAAYASNSRAPTEHATIDDNADGRGTEWNAIFAEFQRIAQLGNDPSAAERQRSLRIDGALAATIIVPTQAGTTVAETDVAETEDFNIE